jgi:hypothetical protein
MISRKTGTALSLSAFCAEFYGVTFGQFLKISAISNFSKIVRAFVVHYANQIETGTTSCPCCWTY